jgi:hypothetical protein
VAEAKKAKNVALVAGTQQNLDQSICLDIYGFIVHSIAEISWRILLSFNFCFLMKNTAVYSATGLK